jgi:hypothetical protein
MMTSYWKIYRVTNPDKVSKDDSFKIQGINSLEVEEKFAEFREEDYTEEYSDFSEAELIAWGRKKSPEKAYYDLPQDLKDDPAITEQNTSLFDENFNAKRFAEDMKYWAITFGINPFSYNHNRNVSKSQNLTTRVSVDSQGKKYTVSLSAAQTNTSREFESISGPARTTITQKTKQNNYEGTFSLRNFIPRLSFNTSASLNESFLAGTKVGDNLSINPLNMSVAIIKVDGNDMESDDIWNFSISPGYLRTYRFNQFFGEETFKNYTLTLSTMINFQVNELAVSLDGNWSPIIDPEDPNGWNTRRVQISSNLNISYPLSDNFNTGFSYTYEYSAIENIGPTGMMKINHTYAFNLSYTKELF